MKKTMMNVIIIVPLVYIGIIITTQFDKIIGKRFYEFKKTW